MGLLADRKPAGVLPEYERVTDWRPSGGFRIEPRTRGGSVTRRAQARRVRSTACAAACSWRGSS